LQALHAIVTSEHYYLSGQPLLTSLRTCYNLYLLSQDLSTRKLAKDSLKEMITFVYKRLEVSPDQAPSPSPQTTSQEQDPTTDSDKLSVASQPVEGSPKTEKTEDQFETKSLGELNGSKPDPLKKLSHDETASLDSPNEELESMGRQEVMIVEEPENFQPHHSRKDSNQSDLVRLLTPINIQRE